MCGGGLETNVRRLENTLIRENLAFSRVTANTCVVEFSRNDWRLTCVTPKDLSFISNGGQKCLPQPTAVWERFAAAYLLVTACAILKYQFFIGK